MNNLCERCKYADITRIQRTIRKGDTVIKQNGGVNITCTNSERKSITFTDSMMVCTGYEPKEREE